MAIRTLGLEEELILVEPATRSVSSRAPEVLKEFREHGPGRRPDRGADEDVEHELFRHQLETRTDPGTELDGLRDQLVAARATAGRAAGAAGLAIIACGTVPPAGFTPSVTRDDRYQDMVDTYGEVALTAGTAGMHVHVGIESDDEGVRAIDGIAAWLPVLIAVSANSPFHDGRDTRHASWRAQLWDRWPSAGPTEPFGDAAGYRAVAQRLIDLGAARDTGMLYFDARLSADQPTVEVRVADVCTDPEDALLLAALVRGLVETAAGSGAPAEPGRVELLRAARWRASRFGLSEALVHPVEGALRPAREVLEALVSAVRPALEEAGDLDLVLTGTDRVLRAGGAARQRAAYERSGSIDGVVDDLVERTTRSWDGGGAEA
jgi:glutamate---cysteine ligase / carboxylate-amine ligase